MKALLQWIRRLFLGAARRRREETRVWKSTVLQTLLTEVVDPEIPYVRDALFSWLITGEDGPKHLRRLDLFLPEVPLAVDVLGPEYSEDWELARPFVPDRKVWEALQEDLTLRRQRMQGYGCPYLEIRHSEAVSAAALHERTRRLLQLRYGG